MKKIMTSKKAEGYIDVVVGIFALMMVLVVTLNIYSFFTLKQDMDEICGQLIETATFNGCFGSEFDERVGSLQAQFFDFDVRTDAEEYYNAMSFIMTTLKISTLTIYRNPMSLFTRAKKLNNIY